VLQRPVQANNYAAGEVGSVGDVYFVRDDYHNTSVTQEMGEEAVDAPVTRMRWGIWSEGRRGGRRKGGLGPALTVSDAFTAART
jgi:hypothetical protein